MPQLVPLVQPLEQPAPQQVAPLKEPVQLVQPEQQAPLQVQLAQPRVQQV